MVVDVLSRNQSVRQSSYLMADGKVPEKLLFWKISELSSCQKKEQETTW
jgi:hypothetical protein